jgi:hypothetical protein
MLLAWATCLPAITQSESEGGIRNETQRLYAD